MSWITKLLPSKIRHESSEKKEKEGVPEGIWSKCSKCGAVLYKAELERNLDVCPKCNHHNRIHGRNRLDIFLDPDNREELAKDVLPIDHLKFKDSKRYKDRLVTAQKMTGEKEALIVIKGSVHGINIVSCAFDFDFIGGSMSSAVGERFVQAVDAAIASSLPLVCFTASGGARMQEGLLSLMQMAKTSAALAKLSQEGLPYVVVLTDPTMAGVAASLAMLGDVHIAEPDALIGFTGPRVIEQTIKETLPEGFQSSEFQLEHGAIDMIIDRRLLRSRIASLLAKLTHQNCLIEDA